MNFFKHDINKKKKIAKRKLRDWGLAYMDDQAVVVGYSSLVDLIISDDDDSPEEIIESKAGRVFRKTVRGIIKQVYKDVIDETREMPTENEFRSELPDLILN